MSAVKTYDPDGAYNFEIQQCCKCRQHFHEDDILSGWCTECLDEMMNNDTICKIFITVDKSGSFGNGNVDIREYCELNIEAFAEFMNDLKAGKYDGMMISTEYMEGAA